MKKKVTVPKTIKPGNGKPVEHLAYLNWEEMDAIRKMNGEGPYKGPNGIPSFVLGGFGLSGAKTYSSTGTQQKTATKSSPAKSSTTMAAAKPSTSRSLSTKMGGGNNSSKSVNAAAARAAQIAGQHSASGKGDFGGIASLPPFSKTVRSSPPNAAAAYAFRDHRYRTEGGPATAHLGVGRITPDWGAPNIAGAAAQRLAMSPETRADLGIDTEINQLNLQQMYKHPDLRTLLGMGEPTTTFSKERGLVSGVRALDPAERDVPGGILGGSYFNDTGMMTYNPNEYELFADARDPLYDPSKSIGSIFAHEVAGHGINDALTITPGSAASVLSELGAPASMWGHPDLSNYNLLNRTFDRLSMIENPFYQGPYQNIHGDEATARASAQRLMKAAGNTMAADKAGAELYALSPDLIRRTSKYNTLQRIMEDREATVARLLNTRTPTFHESRIGSESGNVGPRTMFTGWNPSRFVK